MGLYAEQQFITSCKQCLQSLMFTSSSSLNQPENFEVEYAQDLVFQVENTIHRHKRLIDHTKIHRYAFNTKYSSVLQQFYSHRKSVRISFWGNKAISKALNLQKSLPLSKDEKLLFIKLFYTDVKRNKLILKELKMRNIEYYEIFDSKAAVEDIIQIRSKIEELFDQLKQSRFEKRRALMALKEYMERYPDAKVSYTYFLK